MGRVKTFTNGGSLLPGDLNSIEDDYEFAFSTYKSLYTVQANLNGGATAGTYLLHPRSGISASNDAAGSLYLDPADYLANTRTTKLRVVVSAQVNSTGPAQTLTVGLYPITSPTGGSSGVVGVTLGTVTSGSTVAFASPSANSQNHGNSGDFTFPAAGYYGIAVVVGGTTGANSGVALEADLQLRQV